MQQPDCIAQRNASAGIQPSRQF